MLEEIKEGKSTLKKTRAHKIKYKQILEYVNTWKKGTIGNILPCCCFIFCVWVGWEAASHSQRLIKG